MNTTRPVGVLECVPIPPSRRPAVPPSRHPAVPPSRRPAVPPSRRPAVPPPPRVLGLNLVMPVRLHAGDDAIQAGDIQEIEHEQIVATGRRTW